ncbi:MAG: hypothetical protein A3F54_04430 [Candidatus Kerfeldbacteria bacterium RIFCSPHIGHO2_12_FULL_48_17]|uniref:Uncharacterized protein n=1 Tax=Candidatus Kerfeldbacteria bacterium RIFCSPHIGHO2_12_FULL_48_17 TaxID=1798542 RepID=A0A1G2B1M0_9BACT|nr:MAG: hypothetical protein A3F54_04430 [Candidatus Kerfeldbacteria bacterium RIFCSPHIGHO2_12_FULL_48_17]
MATVEKGENFDNVRNALTARREGGDGMADNDQKTPQQMAAELASLLEIIRKRDKELYTVAAKILDPAKSWLRDWKPSPNVDQLKREREVLRTQLHLYRRAFQKSLLECLKKLVGRDWMVDEMETISEALVIFQEQKDREDLLRKGKKPVEVPKTRVQEIVTCVDAAVRDWRDDEWKGPSHTKYLEPSGSGEKVGRKAIYGNPRLLILCLIKLIQHLHVRQSNPCSVQLYVVDREGYVQFCVVTTFEVRAIDLEVNFFDSSRSDLLQKFGLAIPFWLATYFDALGLRCRKSDHEEGSFEIYLNVVKAQN